MPNCCRALPNCASRVVRSPSRRSFRLHERLFGTSSKYHEMKIVISLKSSFQRSTSKEREGATKGRQRQRKQRYRKSDVAPRVTKRRKGRTTNIENPNNTLFTRTRVTRVTQVTQVYCFGIFPKETTAPLQQDLQELRTAKVVQRMHVQNLVLLRT